MSTQTNNPRGSWDNAPQDLHRPHVNFQKLSPTTFIIKHNGTSHTIAAGELADCIKVDKLLRSHQVPKRFPLSYETVMEAWNLHAYTDDLRRFAHLDASASADGPERFITNGTPISYQDFGIQKEHTGRIKRRFDSIDNDPRKRRWVNDAVWRAATGIDFSQPSHAGPSTSYQYAESAFGEGSERAGSPSPYPQS